MKKEQILKSIKKGLKEVKEIEAGKRVAYDANEVLQSMIKERDKRGGARKGTGLKSALRDQHAGETKQRRTVRLYSSQLTKIVAKYGSLQAAIDGL